MTHDLRITNFGKISEANIKLAPFTAIVGPNSSGKSFITKSLYSIFHTVNQDLFVDTLSEKISQIKSHIRREVYPFDLNPNHLVIFDEYQSRLDKMSKSDPALFDFTLSEWQNFIEKEIPTALSTRIQEIDKHIQELQKKQAEKAKNKISLSSIGISRLTTLKELCSDLKSFIEKYKKSPNETYSKLFGDNLKREFLENFQVSSLKDLTNQRKSLFRISDFAKLELSNEKLNFSLKTNWIQQFQELRNIIYLESPIYLKIRNALIDARDRVSNRFRRSGYLSGVPKYFYDINQLLNSNFMQEDDELNGIVTMLEERIGGSFEIHNDSLSFNDKKVGSIPAHMASSGVSNLGIIALLIKKNILSRGSYLLIDEPEVNLHPEWQHLMLDVLVELSRKDIHIVIATHSLDLIFKLEDTISKEYRTSGDKSQVERRFSINRLNIDGKSEERGELLQDVRQAKIDLGKPYADLYAERLP